MVNLLKHNAQDWSEGGLLVQGTFSFSLLNSFATWFAQHVKRECNSVAHCLAKDVLSCVEDVIDFEVILHCIVTAIQQYSNNLTSLLNLILS